MKRMFAIRGELRTKQRERCCYCQRLMAYHGKSKKSQAERLRISIHDVPLRAETIEHLKRKTDGGTNQIDNLALACFECNTKRGSTDWLTYKSIRLGEVAELEAIR